MSKLLRKSAEWICLLITYLAFYPAAAICSLNKKTTSTKKEILILSNDVLGDAISRTPFFAALRREMPSSDYRISVLVRKSHEEIYNCMPFFDEVISVRTTFDRHPVFWLLHGDLMWILRKNRFSILISCLKEDSLWQRFIRRVLQTETSTGPCTDRTSKYPVISADQRHLALPRIGQSLLSDFNLILKFLKPNADDIRRLRAEEVSFLIRPVNGFELPTPYLAVVPGAGVHYRQWPVERFIQVLKDAIREFPTLSIVILGSKEELKLGEQISKSFPLQARNLCGKTSFRELGGILKNATVVLTNETGSATFSAVLGVPTVCILGGGDFGTYFPVSDFYPNTVSVYHKEPCFRCIWHCSRGTLEKLAPCIDSISETAVFTALVSKLTPIKQSST